MSNLLRKNRVILYRLKRQYGLSGYVYWTTEDQYDVSTGEVSRTYDFRRLRRIVWLPTRQSLSAMISSAFGAASLQNFSYGGHMDQTVRRAIVDARDLDITLTLKHKLALRGQQYEIRSVDLVEEMESYFLQIAALERQETIDFTEPEPEGA